MSVASRRFTQNWDVNGSTHGQVLMGFELGDPTLKALFRPSHDEAEPRTPSRPRNGSGRAWPGAILAQRRRLDLAARHGVAAARMEVAA